MMIVGKMERQPKRERHDHKQGHGSQCWHLKSFPSHQQDDHINQDKFTQVQVPTQ